jgi:hypothetical protein
VDVQQRAGRSGARRFPEQALQAIHQEPPVGESGHGIVVGESIPVGLRREGVPQPERELARVRRLAEEVRRAQLERLQLGLGVGGGGQDDHRDVAQRIVGAHPLQDLEAAHPRHHQVEQHHVGAPLGEEAEDLLRLGH